MRAAPAFGLACIAALQALLGGCDGHKQAPARSLIGDGTQPALPLAPDETVTIGYNANSRSEQHNSIMIRPDGTITLDTDGGTREWRTVSTKRIPASALKALRDRLAVLRPPVRQPGKPEEVEWFLPVGCHTVYDGGTYGGLIFQKTGYAARWVTIPMSGCDTNIAKRIMRMLKPIVNDEPINARAVGLELSN
ncbi:MAG: hypothetical protein WCL10_12965 [Novosphingobium sp.]|uniref:hypothetical protein n=1 Tax=Novosphingobium sp. TaxID=1874826 RepID=UPI003018D24C